MLSKARFAHPVSSVTSPLTASVYPSVKSVNEGDMDLKCPEALAAAKRCRGLLSARPGCCVWLLQTSVHVPREPEENYGGTLTTKQDRCWIKSLHNSKLVRLLLLLTLLYKQRNWGQGGTSPRSAMLLNGGVSL